MSQFFRTMFGTYFVSPLYVVIRNVLSDSSTGFLFAFKSSDLSFFLTSCSALSSISFGWLSFRILHVWCSCLIRSLFRLYIYV